MNTWQFKLCDIQGRLFELSVKAKLDSVSFIKAFMNSKVALHLDSEYNRMQWAGEEYLLEELFDECKDNPISFGTSFGKDVMYWIGYLYRYWHFLTGESSKKIFRQASAETMKRNYFCFHTMENKLAVENLQEIYRQKHNHK